MLETETEMGVTEKLFGVQLLLFPLNPYQAWPVAAELSLQPESISAKCASMSCPVVALTSVKLLGVNACPSMKWMSAR
jgi:hypothetical protein